MFTFLHPLVDFCSVAVLAAGGITFERWLMYNALAFALQLPLGVVLDARRGWGRAGFGVGCALTAGGAVAMVCGVAGWPPLVAACVGNALFHLTAGANVLERSPGKSGPIGLFISTGALGLMAGLQVAGGGCAEAALPVLARCFVVGVACVLVAGAAWQTPRWRSVCDAFGRVGRPPLPMWGAWIVGGLFVLVVWRSWAGLLAGSMSSGAGLAFALAGAFVTWAGKTAGGYLADALARLNPFDPVNVVGRGPSLRSPRVLVTLISVAGSAALCFVCSPSKVLLWLGLLFVAHLATGPVLSLMYDRCGRRAGMAFGLNCFGLFSGSLI